MRAIIESCIVLESSIALQDILNRVCLPIINGKERKTEQFWNIKKDAGERLILLFLIKKVPEKLFAVTEVFYAFCVLKVLPELALVCMWERVCVRERVWVERETSLAQLCFFKP